MNVDLEYIKEELLKKHCGKHFIKDALTFSAYYRGDIELFIKLVEDKLDDCENIFSFDDVAMNGFSNDGIEISEWQYNGDTLTSYGYELNYENKRY